jgi:putative transcriptional regulator
MSPVHHLDEATLISYSAGALSMPLMIVAATHMATCKVCRDRLSVADRVGGALIQRQESASVDPVARAAMLARLEDEAETETAPEPDALDLLGPRRHDPDRLPEFLHRYFGSSYSGLRWRTLVPGVRRVRARAVEGGDLMLLSIAPGPK